MFDADADSRRPWRAWRMDDLTRSDAATGTLAGAATGAPGKPTPAPSGEQQRLDAVRDAAQREGYEAGFAEGRAAGFEQGRDEGREAGRVEFDERRRQLLAPVAPLVDGLRAALDQLDAEIGDALVDVALAVGHKLAGDALDAHPEQVRVLIHELLHEEPLCSGQPCLRLHPDDAALVDDELARDLDAAGWKVMADASIERGGCRLTGPEGELNATRETRWLALLARVRRYGSAPVGHAATDGTT